MAEIQPKNWLQWHSGQKAQALAVRLLSWASSSLPDDQELLNLASQEIQSDLLDFTFYARRSIELGDVKGVTLLSHVFWPSPKSEFEKNLNLQRCTDLIVHSRQMKIVWDMFDVDESPYKTNKLVFPSIVNCQSDRRSASVPIGCFVTTYLCSAVTAVQTSRQSEDA